MSRILLIDDDERLADLLKRYFLQHSYEMDNALRPSDGLTKLESGRYDLVILDIMLPEMDGLEVCRNIRRTSDIPIIMLTARSDVMDRVVGLELGADDYMPKPFEPRELVARIGNILKRSQHSPQHNHSHDNRFCYDPLFVDTELRLAKMGNETLELSSSEYQLLELFVRHPGKTFSRDEILNALKGIDADIFTRSVDILVSRLRHKLKPLEYIKTIRGSGYCFAGKKL